MSLSNVASRWERTMRSAGLSYELESTTHSSIAPGDGTRSYLCGGIRLEFIRDRGYERVYVGPTDAPEETFELSVVAKALGFSEFEDRGALSRLRRLVGLGRLSLRRGLQCVAARREELEAAFAPSRRSETIAAITRLGRKLNHDILGN